MEITSQFQSVFVLKKKTLCIVIEIFHESKQLVYFNWLDTILPLNKKQNVLLESDWILNI